MTKNLLLTVALTGLALTFGPAYGQAGEVPSMHPVVASVKATPPGFAGQYLVSHFAQSEYDWKTAGKYLDTLLKNDPSNEDLVKRSMVLAMGSGDLKLAARRAQDIIDRGDADGLAVMIVCLNHLADNKPQDARAVLDKMPAGDVTDFVRPLLLGWTAAGANKLDTAGLNTTTVHSYNGALMALYLGDKAEAGKFARRMVGNGTVTPYDAERAADIFAAIGDNADALKLYHGVADQDGGKRLNRKIAALEGGKDLKPLIPALRVRSAKQGAAVAVFDLARILFQEQSDATARLFANMALTLDPDMMDARLLLADALAHNGRYEEALAYFANLKPSDPAYPEIAHAEADMLENAWHSDQALKLLNSLFVQTHDIDAPDRHGRCLSQQAGFPDALKVLQSGGAADRRR